MKTRQSSKVLLRLSLAVASLLTWLNIYSADAAARQDLDAFLKKAQYAPVPLQRKPNRLIVEALINEAKGSFLVDSGWSISSIDDRAFGLLKPVRESGIRLRDPVFSNLDRNSVTVIERLKLGPLDLINQPLTLMRLKRRDVQESAVLGGEFFVRKFCILDCGSSRLYVRDSPLSMDNRVELTELLRANGFAGRPIDKAGLFVVSCLAEINGIEANLLVDTGAVSTVLDRGIIDRLQIPRTEKRGRTIRGAGRIGASWLYATKLDSLKIGGVLLTNVSVGVADLSRWGIADERPQLNEVKGLLGMDLLMARKAIIDYTNARLWLK